MCPGKRESTPDMGGETHRKPSPIGPDIGWAGPIVGGVEDHSNAVDLPTDVGGELQIGREAPDFGGLRLHDAALANAGRASLVGARTARRDRGGRERRI